MPPINSLLELTKMEGAGNSFLISQASVDPDQRGRWAKQLCDSHFGIGADGLLFLENKIAGLTKWDFYNSDGSEAEFCGNAARCVAQYFYDITGGQETKIVLETRAGRVRCEVIKSGVVAVEMPKPQWRDKKLILPYWPSPVGWVNTGVPHIILEVDHIDDLKKYKLEASQIRSWPGLGAEGSNVTFVYVHSPIVVSAITFERGVEDFTLACGTGSVAAALHVMEKYGKTGCDVEMPGGALLVTKLDDKVVMQGAAQRIAQIQLAKEPRA